MDKKRGAGFGDGSNGLLVSIEMNINGSILGLEPATQALEAVFELLKYLGKPIKPLPQVVHLSGMVLVLSGKRDVYYVVTNRKCSCPSSIYRPGKPCKHQRKYFPGPKKSQAAIEKEADEELARLHKAKWPGGFNGPLEPSETDDWAEIRYWQKKAEKQDQEA